MKFLLDTNICIDGLRGRLPTLATRLRGLRPADVALPAIVMAELLLGVEKSVVRERALEVVESFLRPFEIVPFGPRAASEYARLRAELERRGEKIGANDLLIAATALAEDATLVTRNTAEFLRVPRLRCADWGGAS